MSEINDKILKMRLKIKDMKAQVYPIVNPELLGLDEYIKSLYIKLLCTIILYENDPLEMQVLYLKRIMQGMDIEDPIEEYMKKALELSEVDIEDFILFMKKDIVKCYFAVDGIILLVMGNHDYRNIEYLEELLEVCGLDKNDLNSLSLIAISILQQKSDCYEKAQKCIGHNVMGTDFSPYIKSFFDSGIVSDNEKYIYYRNMTNKGLNPKRIYESNKIIFENMEICLEDSLSFNKCEELNFVNCKFVKNVKEDISCIIVNGCKNIRIEKCSFTNLNNIHDIFKLENCEEVFFQDSLVQNCNFIKDVCGNEKIGLIIQIDGNEKIKISIINSKFQNLTGSSKVKYYRPSFYARPGSIITNKKSYVSNCEFDNIEYYAYLGTRQQDYLKLEKGRMRLFTRKTENIDNKINNSPEFNSKDCYHAKDDWEDDDRGDD